MTGIICVICGVLFYFIMRYNLHMFQLNGYKNDEHIGWVKDNIGKQMILLLLIPIIACCIWMNIVCFILSVVILFFVAIYYIFLKKSNVKKRLAYTMRAKRLVITDICMGLLGAVTAFVFLKIDGTSIVMLLYLFLQPIIIIICNIINSPIEKAINRHYINDAKAILNQNEDLVIIGVTGSYGKTSVKFYLETLLKEKYNVLVTPESYNTPMGIVKTIRGSLNNMHEIFICEMGARRVGQIKEICDIVNPMHGIITAVGEQHLETFQCIDNILNTKFELADALPEGGKLFLNGDNELIRTKVGNYGGSIIYSTQNGGEYTAKNIVLSQLGTTFEVTNPKGDICEFRTKLVGEHNVINILGAIAVANELGIDLNALKVPVRRIQAVPHRMQLIEKGNVTVIDDAFNSNPVGSKAAVETLSLFTGLRILITPGMVELGEKEAELNFLFGTYAARCCDYIFLVGAKRVQPMKSGILAEGFDEEKCIICNSLEEAMGKAMSIKTDNHKFILLENDLPDNY